MMQYAEWRLPERQTRVEHAPRTAMCKVECLPFFDVSGVKQKQRHAETWKRSRNTHVLLRVRATEDGPIPWP